MTKTAEREAEYEEACQERLARVEVLLEAARFDCQVERLSRSQLEKEVRRLECHVAAVESDRDAMRTRLEHELAFVRAVRASLPWRLAQLVRGVLGRRW